jgi:hypothetical protein
MQQQRQDGQVQQDGQAEQAEQQQQALHRWLVDLVAFPSDPTFDLELSEVICAHDFY